MAEQIKPQDIVALAAFFDKGGSLYKQARAELADGGEDYDVNVTISVEGTLSLAEAYQQTPSTSISAVKALTHMIAVLMEDDDVGCSKQKALALCNKVLERCINPDYPTNAADEKELKKNQSSTRKRFANKLGLVDRKGASSFDGFVRTVDAADEEDRKFLRTKVR